MKNTTKFRLGNSMGISSVSRQILENSEQMDEGLAKSLKSAALATMMMLTGLAPDMAMAKAVSSTAKTAASKPKTMQKVVRPKDLGKNKDAAKTSYNGLSKENLINLIANITYNETMQDYVKYDKDPNIVYAFLNLLSNRAGGSLDNIAKEISRRAQFSSFPKHVKNKTVVDNGFNVWNPEQEGTIGKNEKDIWEFYKKTARTFVDGKIPDVIGDRNMLANKAIDDPDEYEKWGKYCDKSVGSQMYGYRKEHDGYRRYRTVKPPHLHHNPPNAEIEYEIKSGDTLWGIAKQFKTTVEKLVKDNGLSATKSLKPGQKLKIKNNQETKTTNNSKKTK